MQGERIRSRTVYAVLEPVSIICETLHIALAEHGIRQATESLYVTLRKAARRGVGRCSGVVQSPRLGRRSNFFATYLCNLWKLEP